MQALSFGGVFLAGIISFFSPCILPIIPVFISTLIGAKDENDKALIIGKLHVHAKPLLRVTMFVLGLATSFGLLGFTFGWVGRLINSEIFMLVCGIIVILLGIYQTGLVKIPLLMREKKLQTSGEKKGMFGAYLLGFTLSFGWTPCIGPILAAVVALTASQGGALLGLLYMLIYSLGMMIPFLVFTVFSDMLLDRIKGIYKYMKTIKIVGGIIIIIIGVFVLTDSLHLIRF